MKRSTNAHNIAWWPIPHEKEAFLLLAYLVTTNNRNMGAIMHTRNLITSTPAHFPIPSCPNYLSHYYCANIRVQ